ncbi:hypothetical protein DH09_11770 [Bacillaceae bacterium JMAK1]|nr:hypothetical protein DH09_11770 [Bacillaceae bacterium JMAK1]
MKTTHYTTAVDVHVAGEMFRVIEHSPTEGVHSSVADYKNDCLANDEYQRLVREPRGHKDMNLCVLTPPVHEQSTAGVVAFRGTLSNCHSPSAYLAAVAYLKEVRGQTGNFRLDGAEGSVDVIDKGEELTLLIDNDSTIKRVDADFQLSANTLWKVDQFYEDHRGKDQTWRYLVLKDQEGTFVGVESDGHIDRSPLSVAMTAPHSGKVQNFLGNTIHVECEENGRLRLTAKPMISTLSRFTVDPTDPMKDGFLIK